MTMDDRLKESLSALMDDEANELELQRVLSHADKDNLLKTWKSYHRAQSVIQSEHNNSLIVDISESVSQAIANEAALNTELEDHSTQPNTIITTNFADTDTASNHIKNNVITKISSGLAIAASLFVALIFVVQNGLQGTEALHETALLDERNLVVVPTTVAIKKEPKLIEDFTEEHARRFNEYLLRHAEHSVASSHASMIPLVRVASVNAVGI